MGFLNGILGAFGGIGSAIWLILGAGILFFFNSGIGGAT